mmetsp:Transcript_5101/g.4316  ORF Transcript_5101/g.4316 Transcript_5101/m.4316 type:complete len:140 (-) Transcript_5101:62-481(-)
MPQNKTRDAVSMNHNNIFKDQGLTFNRTFFSSIQSRDSHSPVPRLNLNKLKYRGNKTDMKMYADKLEESIKLFRNKIKTQVQEFDKLRHKYVKMASQNKKLFDLNERLKNGLRDTKEKLIGFENDPKRGLQTDTDKCEA